MRQTSVNYARVLAELSVPADDLRNAAAMLKGCLLYTSRCV